ncbi:MAG: 6-carboxytetrahydropterin synthase QueD [Methanotrichaceae archaeon]|nr:6-carboxytetrahydropterin synthase QueD [Methanotrichaceae archaeon]
MKLGLIAEFDAAHSLPGYQGKCSNIHGHTYKAEVVIEGLVGNDGFVIDFYRLKSILGTILANLDHNNLNHILPNPTSELIAELIASRLRQELEGSAVKLVYLKLWEGRNKWVMVE